MSAVKIRRFIQAAYVMLIISACGTEVQTGNVTLVFGSGGARAAAPSEVARVIVTVSASDMNTIGPLEVSTGTLSLSIDVDAGLQRRFDASAYDHSDVLIYEGSAVADIPEGANLTVQIIMGPPAGSVAVTGITLITAVP